jgi:hypothetical protein
MGLSKEKAIEMLNSLDSEEVILRTPEQEADFLKNYKDTEVEAEIGQRISKVHSQYDEDFERVFGVRKAGDQKSYEFFKQHGEKLKQEASEAQKLKERIKTLEESGSEASKKTIEALKKEIEEVQAASVQKQQEYESKLQEYEQKTTRQMAMVQMENDLIGVEWKKEIPETVRNAYIKTVQERLIAQSERIDGVLTFKDEKGTLRNKETLKPLTSKEMQMMELAALIKEGKTQPGTGGTGAASSHQGVDIPGNVTSKVELQKYLIEVQGLVRGTEEFTKAYNELSPKLEKIK